MDKQNILANIPLPKKIKVDNEKGNTADIIIEPCYPGYGNTLGNVLRRVLLSSLSGAAVTAVKIKGVDHEFSAIPHIKEDVLTILLNLKELNLRVNVDEPVRLSLNISGKKEIKAGDIDSSSDVEIIDPEHHIATATHPDAKLEMEIVVDRGRGYEPVEQKDRKDLEVGMILIDSIYTPVVKVGYHIDNMRVGQVTNYDRLTLNIETDGTISPMDAVKQSADVLLQHFEVISDPAKAEAESKAAKAEAESKAAKANDTKDDTEVTFDDLKLSARTSKALAGAEIVTIKPLAKMSAKELLDIDGFGERALEEVRQALDKAEITHMLDS